MNKYQVEHERERENKRIQDNKIQDKIREDKII